MMTFRHSQVSTRHKAQVQKAVQKMYMEADRPETPFHAPAEREAKDDFKPSLDSSDLEIIAHFNNQHWSSMENFRSSYICSKTEEFIDTLRVGP